MHLELYIIFHYMIATVTFKSPVSCDPSPKALGDRATSLWKWCKDGQGNEKDWRRSLHLQCLYRCARAYLKAVLPFCLPGRSACIHAPSYIQTPWGTCGKYNLWLHHVAVKLQRGSSDMCMRSMARTLQTVETFPPQMWQMVWQHKLTWEHPFALSLALLHLALNVLCWAYRGGNWQRRLLPPCCYLPSLTLDQCISLEIVCCHSRSL